MKTYEYLIIGGGIAGITAAETIRASVAGARIGILSSEQHLPYSRVLLPSYLKKRIGRPQIFLRTEEDLSRARIDFMRGSTAASVDTAGRRVICRDAGEIAYGKLLIAAGGRANHWPHGEEGARIFRLQTLDDADRLYAALDTIRTPVVIGSSFIALEFIETFLQRGIVPRVLAREEHFFHDMIDRDGAAILHENMASRGVSLLLGDEALALEKAGAALRIARYRSGALEADAVAVGIGITRNTDFLAGSGIVCSGGGVQTDAFLETNVPGVYAAGDIAAYFDPIAGRHRLVGNWTNAVLQGACAGRNMAGSRERFSAVPAYSITNLGLQITALGECDGALETISRVDRTARRYERFFLRDGVLAGAFLINWFSDKPRLAELISRRAVVALYAERLRNMSFDIREIPAML
ncbi:MAG: FAD/NAD(P)-binding oxidoreductase [Patescibacteria group bacterium]